MGELLKYSEISKLAADIFTSNESNMTWLEALDKAKEIYEGGENVEYR